MKAKSSTVAAALVFACVAIPAMAQQMTPEQWKKLNAEVQKQKEAEKASIVNPLSPEDVLAAAKAQGAANISKIVSTVTVRSSMFPVGQGRVSFYHASAVADTGATFNSVQDKHDYPLPAMFIYFDQAKRNTNYLLDCRFSSPDGPQVKLGYSVYDDVHRIHENSIEETKKGHLTELMPVGAADGVTVHLSFTDLNVKRADFQGCEIYELGL
jgi:hypothetical protein